MTDSRPKILLATALIAVLCSCSGTSPFSRTTTPIPELEIARLAEQIEEFVLNVKPEDPMDSFNIEADEEISGEDLMGEMIGTEEVLQKVPALVGLGVDNEAVIAAVKSRALRRSAIREFEKNGCLGENRRALLHYLGGEWCPPGDELRNRAGYIVLRENGDRRLIFEQIVEANDLGSSSIGRIREIFAEQIQKKAWAGTPIEKPDGVWERK
jgi:hypothetical protein